MRSAASPENADRRSHRERMRAGDLYMASDPEVRAGYERAQELARAVNETPVEDIAGRRPHLARLLGSLGAGSDVLPPVRCDYGRNVHLGARVFVNFGANFLDTCPIRIGDDVLIGPAVQFLAADHPLDPATRHAGWESGRPITINDGAWLGGGAIVLSGVTIGTNAVVGAGSVVNRDVPSGAVVAGNPARVISSNE
jgi:maltose O-acetyltransferase